jgi:hypothetical protein
MGGDLTDVFALFTDTESITHEDGGMTVFTHAQRFGPFLTVFVADGFVMGVTDDQDWVDIAEWEDGRWATG